MHPRDLASLAGETTIFGGSAAGKLKRLQTELEPLSRRYDVVVANPPYMGSSSLGKWMGSWVKKHWPEAYRDLCTCFIDRGFGMSSDSGYSAMVTMQSWMFLGSFEKLRGKILRNHSISSMAHLGTRAFGAIGGEVVSTAATVFANAKCEVKGAYFRLVDMGSEEEKQAGLLEALANPDCGWFYRADASQFEVITGGPIAYWAGESLITAFKTGRTMSTFGKTSKGLMTGDNAEFMRLWWECRKANSLFRGSTFKDTLNPKYQWFSCTKGGSYRKWSGNLEWMINWSGNGSAVRAAAEKNGHHCQDYSDLLKFKPAIAWSAISSDLPSFRYAAGQLSEHAGMCLFASEDTFLYMLALMNTSISQRILELIAPTLNFNAGDIDALPVIMDELYLQHVNELALVAIQLTDQDWNSFETSWGFGHHPLA